MIDHASAGVSDPFAAGMRIFGRLGWTTLTSPVSSPAQTSAPWRSPSVWRRAPCVTSSRGKPQARFTVPDAEIALSAVAGALLGLLRLCQPHPERGGPDHRRPACRGRAGIALVAGRQGAGPAGDRHRAQGLRPGSLRSQRRPAVAGERPGAARTGRDRRPPRPTAEASIAAVEPDQPHPVTERPPHSGYGTPAALRLRRAAPAGCCRPRPPRSASPAGRGLVAPSSSDGRPLLPPRRHHHRMTRTGGGQFRVSDLRRKRALPSF